MAISQLKRTITGTMDEIITKQTSNGIDPDIKYVATDAPTFSITNAQMASAITTQQRFYNNNDVYFCVDDGAYTKDTLYKFVTSGETYSWEQVESGGGGLETITITTASKDLVELLKDNTLCYLATEGAVQIGEIDGKTYALWGANGPYLAYKATDAYGVTNILLLNTNVNTKTGMADVVIFSSYYAQTRLTFNTTSHELTEVNTGLMFKKVNGSQDQANLSDCYVPSTSGETGQILVSGGIGNAPTWGENPAPKILSNTVVSNWVADATYADFGYKADIAIDGLTAASICEIIFSQDDAASGNYAQVCLSGTGILTIYSKVNDTITIPTIMVYISGGQGGSASGTPQYYTYTFSDYATLFNTLWTIYEKNPSAIIKLTSSELVKGSGVTYTFNSSTATTPNEIVRTTADFNFIGTGYEYYLKLDSIINTTNYKAILTSYEFNASTYTVVFGPTYIDILGKRIRNMTGTSMDITHAELYSENVSTLTLLTFDIFTTADSLPQSTSNEIGG